jgi:hypothetical protein
MKDTLLRRAAKLFDDYKVLLDEGEGHKALLKLCAKLSNNNDLEPVRSTNTLDKRSIDVKGVKGSNEPLNGVSGSTGRIIKDMDFTLSRIDDLLKQFLQKNIDEVQHTT